TKCSSFTWNNYLNQQPGSRGGARDGGAPGLFAGGHVAYRFKHCTDGLSQTFLVGEVLPGLYIHHMLFHSHYNVASTHFPPNYHRILGLQNNEYATANSAQPGFKSEHVGGLNMCLADGSVSFVT